MSCAACQARVEKAVGKVPGVTSVAVSLLTNSMGVEGTAAPEEVIRAVTDAGYGAKVQGSSADTRGSASAETGRGGASAQAAFAAQEEALRDHETPLLKRRLILSAAFLAALMYITMGHNMWGWPLPSYFHHNHLGLTLTQMVLASIVMIINRKFFTSGFGSLLHGAPNMDTLVALGSSVSFCWSLFVFYKMCGMITAGADNMALMELYHSQLYFESAAMIPALITVGKMLEAMSKGRTTDALKSLMKIAPQTAVVLRNGEETEVAIGEVAAGDIFVVRPGENIPADGTVLEGISAVNESALTGESIPVDKKAGDHVSAATINQSGYLQCRADRVGEDTTLAQIIHMVSDAAATKAPIARIADRVSGVFVPAVIGIAAVVTAGWLLHGETLSFALARGISVLVISCPCALGLATPVAIMAGNGLGARNGILFKTSEALENAGKTEVIALDKTGTITSGEPAVTDLLPAEGISEKELLTAAFSLEQKSEHPLAKAIVDKAGQEQIAAEEAEDFLAKPGSGLEAVVSGRHLHGGNSRYIRQFCSVSAEFEAKAGKLAEEGKTPLWFEADGELLGVIAAADVMKVDSAEAIRELQNLGLHVVMLTGDNEKTARAIGAAAGVNDVVAGVLPDGKEAVIRELQKRGRTAMVGDGINDAPALTRADTGIAIGAGTDVAIDSADVVLMNSTLKDAAAAIRLSRAVLRNIHENLFWAFFYNLICIPLAAGLFVWKMNPMVGAAAMSLSSFTVCMNALRLNLFRVHDASHDRPLRSRKKADTDESGFQKQENVPESAADSTGMQMETESAADGTGMQMETGTAAVTTAKGGDTQMEKTVQIEGMMCAHCEATVKKALEALDFVEEAVPSHEENRAVLKLSGAFDEEAVRKAVEDKDYTFAGVL